MRGFCILKVATKTDDYSKTHILNRLGKLRKVKLRKRINLIEKFS